VNIFRKQVQERLKIARLDTLIRLLYQFPVCLFVHNCFLSPGPTLSTNHRDRPIPTDGDAIIGSDTRAAQN
jgi:hypothetical protein